VASSTARAFPSRAEKNNEKRSAGSAGLFDIVLLIQYHVENIIMNIYKKELPTTRFSFFSNNGYYIIMTLTDVNGIYLSNNNHSITTVVTDSTYALIVTIEAFDLPNQETIVTE